MPRTVTKQDAGRTTAPRIHTCHSDDESGRCRASGGCEVCRNSPPSTPPSQTTSTTIAAFLADLTSRPTEPPLSQSGAVFVLNEGAARLALRRLVRIRLTPPARGFRARPDGVRSPDRLEGAALARRGSGGAHRRRAGTPVRESRGGPSGHAPRSPAPRCAQGPFTARSLPRRGLPGPRRPARPCRRPPPRPAGRGG